jgi:hypothetical protein
MHPVPLTFVIVVALLAAILLSFKRVRCLLLCHRWDWREIEPAEFARRVIHGPPFGCLRCGEPWRLRG